MVKGQHLVKWQQCCSLRAEEGKLGFAANGNGQISATFLSLASLGGQQECSSAHQSCIELALYSPWNAPGQSLFPPVTANLIKVFPADRLGSGLPCIL